MRLPPQREDHSPPPPDLTNTPSHPSHDTPTSAYRDCSQQNREKKEKKKRGSCVLNSRVDPRTYSTVERRARSGRPTEAQTYPLLDLYLTQRWSGKNHGGKRGIHSSTVRALVCGAQSKIPSERSLPSRQSSELEMLRVFLLETHPLRQAHTHTHHTQRRNA